MVDLITIRIQVGLDKRIQFSKTVPQDSTVDDIRRIIRLHQEIESSDGVVLISNGQSLQNPDITLADLGICNDSMIICIISKEKGRDIEKLIGGDEKEKYKGDRMDPILECEFGSRPFGFAVWADERGKNSIVIKVAGETALRHGIQIGYCVYKVNGIDVFDRKHKEILHNLKTTACPLRITFLDFGNEYIIRFHEKPLGFTVVHDKEYNNARVSKVSAKSAIQKGLKVGSYIISVNDKYLYGMKHSKIIQNINNAQFPIRLMFRQLPKLMIVTKEKKILSKTKKLFTWAAR